MDQLTYLQIILGQLQGISFDTKRLSILFPRSINQTVIAGVDTAILEIETNSTEESELDISNLDFYFYFNELDFRTRTSNKRWDLLTYIHSGNIIYNPTTGQTHINGSLSNSYFLIRNNHLYFELLIFLKGHEHQEGKILYFVDYFSWDSRIIVFTTLKKEGKLSINFTAAGLELQNDIRLKENLERFKLAFGESSRNFPKFIKNELISQLSKYHINDRMQKLLEEFVAIMNIAEQNFEIYLHDLSLENLKKDFIEHKNKYFNQSREILSKLTNQVIGLPITIAASVFSTYKVSDSASTLLTILFVFSLYAIYSIFLLKLQKEDIRDLKRMFEKDYEYIKNSQFFQKFPDQLADFKLARDQISNRFQQLIIAINIYYILFCASVIAFIIYLIMQLALAFSMLLLSGLILCVLFMCLYFVLIK